MNDSFNIDGLTRELVTIEVYEPTRQWLLKRNFSQRDAAEGAQQAVEEQISALKYKSVQEKKNRARELIRKHQERLSQYTDLNQLFAGMSLEKSVNYPIINSLPKQGYDYLSIYNQK